MQQVDLRMLESLIAEYGPEAVGETIQKVLKGRLPEDFWTPIRLYLASQVADIGDSAVQAPPQAHGEMLENQKEGE